MFTVFDKKLNKWSDIHYRTIADDHQVVLLGDRSIGQVFHREFKEWTYCRRCGRVLAKDNQPSVRASSTACVGSAGSGLVAEQQSTFSSTPGSGCLTK